jgi:hypothetical protein
VHGEVKEYIDRYIASGFYNAQQIEQIVGQDVFSGAIPPDQLRDLIDHSMRQKPSVR